MVVVTMVIAIAIVVEMEQHSDNEGMVSLFVRLQRKYLGVWTEYLLVWNWKLVLDLMLEYLLVWNWEFELDLMLHQLV